MLSWLPVDICLNTLLCPVVILGSVIVLLLAVIFQQSRAKSSRINETIKTGAPKVVDKISLSDVRIHLFIDSLITSLPLSNALFCCQQIEDADKLVLCRCWKSAKWPYCDGSHNNHNSANGDNVGPLIIENDKKPKPEN